MTKVVDNRLVFVSGGTGYLGSALVPMIAKKYPVRVLCSMEFGNAIEGTPNAEFIKGDIRDEALVQDALNGVTDVIHLAAIVTDELVDMNSDYARTINYRATDKLVTMARQARVGRFVYVSSSSVYGSQDQECDEITPARPMTEYAKQKLAGENAALSYSRSDMAVTSVRMATLAGPAPRMRLDTIVNTFSKQAYWDKKITVWGGEQWRSNVHIDDAVDAYMKLLDAPVKKINGEIFNLVYRPMQAWDIALQVQSAAHSVLKAQVGIDFDKTKSDDRHYRMAGEKFRDIGIEPLRSIHIAAADNFRFFDTGAIGDPNDPLYSNTKRMKEIVTHGA